MAKSPLGGNRRTHNMVSPSKLVVVTDKTHALYDERCKLQLNKELAESIRVHGVREPLSVKIEGNELLVVDGRQRLKAALHVAKTNKSLKIPVIEAKGSEQALGELVSVFNSNRVIDDPITEANKLQRMMDRGSSKKECAVAMGFSVKTVERRLKLLTLDPKVQLKVKTGAMTSDEALALLGESKEDQQAASRRTGNRKTGSDGKKQQSRTPNKVTIRKVAEKFMESDPSVTLALLYATGDISEGMFKKGIKECDLDTYDWPDAVLSALGHERVEEEGE